MFRSALAILASFVLLTTPAAMHAQAKKARARDLGVPFPGTPGPLNAITDVTGVAVGHTTLVSGEGPLKIGEGPGPDGRHPDPAERRRVEHPAHVRRVILDCPYKNEERFWFFELRKECWKRGKPTMTDVELIFAICREKGWKVNGH